MKTIDVSEATGAVLDWLVDNIEGVKNYGIKDWLEQRRYNNTRRYSTDWSQGGPIIEREGINLTKMGHHWLASHQSGHGHNYGLTPLIAAMRCFVSSKLGNTVEVPEELT